MSKIPTPTTLRPVSACPSCDGVEFTVEIVHDQPVVRCHECGAAWRYELGHLLPVS